MNGDSNSSTVVNAKTGEVVKTIALGGAPEFAVADGKGMLYANLADKDQIAAIDTRTVEVKARWPVTPAGEPTALAIDSTHRRLFTAGRKPQMLTILDADSGKVIQSLPISAGTDAAAFDPETGMIFVATIEGNIHAFHEDSPDKYGVVETVKTEYGARPWGWTRRHTKYLSTRRTLVQHRRPQTDARGGAHRRSVRPACSFTGDKKVPGAWICSEPPENWRGNRDCLSGDRLLHGHPRLRLAERRQLHAAPRRILLHAAW
jgi:hypothetical protein